MRPRWDDDHVASREPVVAGGALVVGLGTLALVQQDPGASLAGESSVGGVALLAGGWLAIAGGLIEWRRRPSSPFGVLLVAGGFVWFVGEWNNPAVGSSAVFTFGLILSGASVPVLAHAGLSYRRGRLGSRIELVAITASYVTTLVVGVGSALFFDPAAQGCGQCPTNLVSIADDPQLVRSLGRAGVWVEAASALALSLLACWQLARSTLPGRRMTAPILVPLVGYLGAVLAASAHALDRGTLSTDSFDRRFWLAEAAALALLALGVATAWARSRAARSAVAGLVVELGDSPPAGGLRSALAASLGDTELDIAYPIGDNRFVDASGDPVHPERNGGATTALVRAGRTIAVLIHRRDLLGDPHLVQEAASAAGLALEHERLQAESRAQLVELRSSRFRLVAAGDAERRKLERDLHDGAQQLLVGLALELQRLSLQLGAESTATAATVGDVRAELSLAIDDLREVASGIHPAILEDLGLRAALEALAETVPGGVRVVTAPAERLSPVVETAAYLLVAGAAKTGGASVAAVLRNATLIIEVDAASELPTLVDLQDRVAALDGTLDVHPAGGGGVCIRAVIPCG